MPMPDLMTQEELHAEGFVLQTEDTARHVQYPAWRYRCHGCGLWVREIDDRDGPQTCLRCAGNDAERSELAIP